jgi:hypothetical protein
VPKDVTFHFVEENGDLDQRMSPFWSDATQRSEFGQEIFQIIVETTFVRTQLDAPVVGCCEVRIAPLLSAAAQEPAATHEILHMVVDPSMTDLFHDGAAAEGLWEIKTPPLPSTAAQKSIDVHESWVIQLLGSATTLVQRGLGDCAFVVENTSPPSLPAKQVFLVTHDMELMADVFSIDVVCQAPVDATFPCMKLPL